MGSKKSRKKESRKNVYYTSSYFNPFLSILMQLENVPYPLAENEMNEIGAIEFEISNMEDLARISALIKQVLTIEELGLQGENGIVIPW
jgi:hypothetical protein